MSYSFLFIIYYFQVKPFLFNYFVWIAEEPSSQMCKKASVIRRILLLVMFMTRRPSKLYPCIVLTFLDHKCLFCVWSCYWFYAWDEYFETEKQTMIKTKIWIVLILDTIFATKTVLTAWWKNTSDGGKYFGGVMVWLLQMNKLYTRLSEIWR